MLCVCHSAASISHSTSMASCHICAVPPIDRPELTEFETLKAVAVVQRQSCPVALAVVNTEPLAAATAGSRSIVKAPYIWSTDPHCNTWHTEMEPGFLASWDGAQNLPSGRGAVSVQISGARPTPQHMLRCGVRAVLPAAARLDIKCRLPMQHVCSRAVADGVPTWPKPSMHEAGVTCGCHPQRRLTLLLEACKLRIRRGDTVCPLPVPGPCSRYRRRYAILDGREPDLDAGLPASLVPVISKVWFWAVS